MKKIIIACTIVTSSVFLGAIILNSLKSASKSETDAAQPSVLGTQQQLEQTQTPDTSTPMDPSAPFASPITKSSYENSYSLSEVAKHAQELDCWIIVDGFVYDMTTFIPNYPDQNILTSCGKDASKLFRESSFEQTKNVLPEYLIGKLGK